MTVTALPNEKAAAKQADPRHFNINGWYPLSLDGREAAVEKLEGLHAITSVIECSYRDSLSLADDGGASDLGSLNPRVLLYAWKAVGLMVAEALWSLEQEDQK